MHPFLVAGLALALAAPWAARADTAADIQALRQEIAALRAAHEARLQDLEQRLQAAMAATPTASAPMPAPPPAPMPAPAVAANAFNPAISLILSGLYTRSSQDPARYAIAGFPLPADAAIGPGTRGFSLTESELGLAADIDPWLRGAISLSLHADDAVSVEEAFIQTTSLGHGLTVKAGRFFSGVGYLNAQHAHRWDFVDNPLAYQALLGTQYGDDGVQLTWLAPTDQFVEFGAELGRGRGFPGGDNPRHGAGMRALTAHTGGDLGASHNWRLGLSVLSAQASDQPLAGLGSEGEPITHAFSGRTRVWIVDGVWKWAPEGNATRTGLTLQGEVLRSTRRGELVYDVDGTASAGRYRVTQSGWYLQGVYQFMPRWRVGLRTERLDSGAPDYGLNADRFAGGGERPRKHTLMLDFSPSEFARVRLQWAHDRARLGASDQQFFVQYQMSLGAHGAHGY